MEPSVAIYDKYMIRWPGTHFVLVQVFYLFLNMSGFICLKHWNKFLLNTTISLYNDSGMGHVDLCQVLNGIIPLKWILIGVYGNNTQYTHIMGMSYLTISVCLD